MPLWRNSRAGCTSRFILLTLNFFTLAVMSALVFPHRAINAFASSLPKKLSSQSQAPNIIQRRRTIPSNARIKSNITHNHRLKSTGENDYSLELLIPTAEDMEDIGGLLSVDSTKGDTLLLDGDLGAGKTCFSRGFIRGRTGSPNERVTSPTYLLSNSYSVDGGSTNIYHMDLYRLSGEEEDLAPLSLEHVFANEISLIEWSSRLITKPPLRLDVNLAIDSTIQSNDDGTDSKCRCMTLVPYGDRWLKRLKFLESEGYFEDLIIDSSTTREE